MYYLIFAILRYALPLFITGLVAGFLYRRYLRRWGRWGIALSVAIALMFSCAIPALQRLSMQLQVAAVAPDEVRPSRLQLVPGPVLRLNGLSDRYTCRRDCDLQDLPFASSVYAENMRETERFPVVDFWAFLSDADRTQPFPYHYAFISMEPWSYAQVVSGDPQTFRLPHWSNGVTGIHLLVEIPENGVLDIIRNKPLYQRLSLQGESVMWFGWFMPSNDSIYVPTFAEMVNELTAITRDD